jgi:Glycosyltransferase family 87
VVLRRRGVWAERLRELGEVARDNYGRILLGLLFAGAAIRIVLSLTTYGVAYDLESLRIVSDRLSSEPFHVYDSLRWPYGSGFFPLMLVFRELADATSFSFQAAIKLPSIGADLAIAWIVQGWLRSRGRSALECLAAAALVALGPSFVFISAYHGQIDSVSTLFALLGVLAWKRGGSNRAMTAGVLIGIGAAIKTVPLFMVLALLPSVRFRREALELAAVAVAVPFLTIAPWLLADYESTKHALTANHGVPGFGGLSLFVQPDLLDTWLYGDGPATSGVTNRLVEVQNILVGSSVLCVGLIAYLRRLDPLLAAALIWLTVYVFNPNWAFQYVVWGLPFFLLVRRHLQVAILQLVLVLPASVLYFRFSLPDSQDLYLPIMAAVWLWMVFELARCVRSIAFPPQPRGAEAPLLSGR